MYSQFFVFLIFFIYLCTVINNFLYYGRRTKREKPRDLHQEA
jgi:hypothetical protein